VDEKQAYKIIGQNIVRLRTERNLTQVQLANLCDFEKANMSRLELGKINPTIKTLLKVSVSLNVPLSDLTNLSI
jgi:transcriptional regulator with XRE-family HTH domain